MDVTEAIATAKAYVQHVFAGDDVAEVELEETAFDRQDQTWRITVSFSRPRPPIGESTPLDNPGAALLEALAGRGRRRLHKVVVIDRDGAVSAMKDRAWLANVE